MSTEQKKLERDRRCGRVTITDYVHRLCLILCTSDAPCTIGGDQRVCFVAAGIWRLRVNQQADGYACSRLMNTMASNRFTRGVQRSIEEQSHAYHELRIALQSAGGFRNIFRLPKNKGSCRLRKRSSRTDRQIVRLVRADSTHSSTEMVRVVYCSVPLSTVQRRLLELNFRSVKRPNAVELFVLVRVGRWDTVTGDVSVDGLSDPMMYRFD